MIFENFEIVLISLGQFQNFQKFSQASYAKLPSQTCSAISRAILKLVYWFGNPNWDPQTLKSVDFWCKLLLPFVAAEPQEQCSELFRMQNSQNFPGFCPWTPLGSAYSAPKAPQLHNGFSPCYTCWKTSTPKKLLDMALTCDY